MATAHFSEEQARRIAEVVRYVEATRTAASQDAGDVAAPSEAIWVRVTSGTPDGDGNYPAEVTLWDQDGTAWADVGAVKLKSENASALTSGQRYTARASGYNAAGEAVFVTLPGGTSGVGGASYPDIYIHTTADAHETTTHPIVTTGTAAQYLVFDQVSGFVISDDVYGDLGGRRGVTIRPANGTDGGIVSGTTQTFAGVKTFDDDVVFAGTATAVHAVATLTFAVGSAVVTPAVTVYDSGSSFTGQTGTIAPGAVVKHGFVTSLGSGTVGSVTSVDGSGGSTGLTLTGGAITSSGTLTLAGTLNAASGGTGRATHTAYAVLCGGTTTTGAQQSVASVGTSGQALVSAGAGALPQFSTLGIAGGGTGLTTAPGNGKLLIGGTGTYSLANLTAGNAITVTNGAGSITIAANSAGTVTGSRASGAALQDLLAKLAAAGYITDSTSP